LEAQYSITNTLFNSIVLLKSDLVSCFSESSAAKEGDNKSNSPNHLKREKESQLEGKSPLSTDVSQISSPEASTMAKKKLSSLGNGPSENKSKEDLFKTYLKEVEDRLKFVRMLKTNSAEQLDIRHARLLWDVLVENALYEAERDLFFSTFNSIIYCNNGNNFSYFKLLN